jgi:hypothetical protein
MLVTRLNVRTKITTAIAAALALSATPLAFAQNQIQANGEAIYAKQLAGPPSEFADLAPASPIAAAIHSKSALIPISLSENSDGELSWQGELPIEQSNARFILFSGANSDWQAELAKPGALRASPAASVVSEQRASSLGIESAQVPGEMFALENAELGTWQLNVKAAKGAASTGFVLIEGNPSTQLVSYLSSRDQRVGDSITINALLSTDKQGELSIDSQLESGRVLLTAPNGQRSEHSMRASISGASFSFKARMPGQYLAQVLVSGKNADGNTLMRSAEHIIAIASDSVDLSSAQAQLLNSADGRLNAQIPVQSRAGNFATHYRAYAQVWGKAADGSDVAVAWIGGMVPVTQSKAGAAINLALDPRWITLAGASAPFELRAMRLEDPNNFVSLESQDKVSLQSSSAAIDLSKSARAIAVDDSMRMGPAPANGVQMKGVGSRLLLVHGYCSGAVWPAGNFSNASTFLDANQSRSHDQFAQRINTFGSAWDSYGIVAHSQGGAASLHLYNYYWSGLDNAGAGRLIQSVGTPYQGTNLAGILATLGSWFGVGCGFNNDLTYSGASAWLAGIPNASRAKVNYHTTSFKNTNWWTNDYCQFATDLVLSDPEDGTTEQAKGQLPGAVNRGHVTGQCHTAGMRDPAQYQDGSRNATMNTNAAR